MLVSRDSVHTGESGREEADAAGLIRVKDFEQAAEVLGRSTPAGRLAREVLSPVWGAIRKAGVPLPEKIDLQRFSELQFAYDAAGRVSSSMGIVANTPKGPVSAYVEIFQVDTSRVQANLHDVRLEKTLWGTGELSVSAPGELPQVTSSFDKRLEELHQTVGKMG